MPDYYDGWEAKAFTCPKCNWEGTGTECKQGEMFQELFELDCPSCGGRITVITYPTVEESHANWDKVSEADKRMIEAREQFLKEAECRCLEYPDELPDIKGDSLVFVWDFVFAAYDTIIRYGNKVIWREPAFYEGYSRFEEVAVILKKKYGAKLIDLVPAERSENALYGDCLSSPKTIECVRDWIGLGKWQDVPVRNTLHGRTEWDWRKVIVENPDTKKITFSDAHSAQALSKLPRLHTIEQLPEIHSDDEMVFVWDEQEADPIPQFVIRYGDIIVWQEFSYYRCYNRFEPIAMLLQQKYGKKVKDLIPTRRSEINLCCDHTYAKAFVSKARGNLWMSRYAPDNEDNIKQSSKNDSDRSKFNNTKPSEATLPSTDSQLLKETRLEYRIILEEDFWFQDDPELMFAGKIIYETYDEALKECKRIIDDFLIENYKPGMAANELYNNYLRSGEEPYVLPWVGSRFSASEYAKERCAEICE